MGTGMNVISYEQEGGRRWREVGTRGSDAERDEEGRAEWGERPEGAEGSQREPKGAGREPKGAEGSRRETGVRAHVDTRTSTCTTCTGSCTRVMCVVYVVYGGILHNCRCVYTWCTHSHTPYSCYTHSVGIHSQHYMCVGLNTVSSQNHL